MKAGLIIVVLGIILKAISPVLRTSLEAGIKALYEKAKTTDVEFDDALIELLADLLDVDLE